MKTSSLLIVLVLSLSLPAWAQTRTGSQPRPRVPTRAKKLGGFLMIDGIYQATSNDFRGSRTFTANAESAEMNTDYTVKAGPAFSAGGGVSFGSRFGVGAGVGRFSVSTPSALTAAVPHPFFFNQPRQVTGDVGGLTREELAVHIQVRGVAPVGRRIQVAGFAGPSFFRVMQDVVTDFSYADQYPYDSATFRSATTTSAKASKIGFNVGGDVTYFFSRQIGIGGTAQFSGATVSLPNGTQQTDVKAGGLQAGGGLRVRF